MYISKKNREIVKDLYDGKCAYTGTELLPDWQIDHVNPVRRNWFESEKKALFEGNHNLQNMLPAQRIINHYKHSMNLEQFRGFMAYFHERLAKLPINPKTEKSIKRKAYMLEIAGLFGITKDKPFGEKFWFETI